MLVQSRCAHPLFFFFLLHLHSRIVPLDPNNTFVHTVAGDDIVVDVMMGQSIMEVQSI